MIEYKPHPVLSLIPKYQNEANDMVRSLLDTLFDPTTETRDKIKISQTLLPYLYPKADILPVEGPTTLAEQLKRDLSGMSVEGLRAIEKEFENQVELSAIERDMQPLY